VELVQKPWTTGASVHGGPASIARWWSSPKPGLQPLRGPRPMAKGQGRGSGARGSHLGPHRSVSGDEAAGRRGGAATVESARWGRALARERRKGGWCGVWRGEVRHGQGAFYRCRGGGRRPGASEVKAAPLMAVHASYQKRRRRRWPIKEG
jgi:hypothetical protein